MSADALRALIVDDEPLSRRSVRQLLAAHGDVTVVGECMDVPEAMAALDSTTVDVVFLDIRLPSESGLELARRTVGDHPFIVFVTAYDQYALPAFEVDAVDFLHKPITQDRFDAALERVRHRRRLRDAATAATASAESAAFTQRLVARERQRDVVIAVRDIDYIEADDVYAAVYAAGRRHLVREPLDRLEQRLDPTHFARIHRRFIVALPRMTALRRARGAWEVVLRGGEILPVSRRRHGVVKEALRGDR
jgi:two-component system LytT family response regulator